MKKLIAITTILLLVTITSSCQRQVASTISVPPVIETGKAIRMNFQKTILTFGRVMPLQQVDIVAIYPGIIKKFFVRDGQYVKKGEKILSIEGLYRVAKEQTAGGVRYVKGGEIIKVAPINGYVSLKEESAGRFVKSGAVMASVVNLNSIIIEVEVFGNKKELVRVGQDVEIFSSGKIIRGKINSLQPVSDYQTGGRVVEIRLHQKRFPLLFPGDFVKVKIVVEEHKNSLAVPESAVISTKGKKIVFVKKNKNLFKKVKVKTGLAEKGYVEITSGLKGDETIVVKGGYELLNKNIRKTLKVGD